MMRLLILLLAAGCATAPTENFYVLSAGEAPPAAVAAAPTVIVLPAAVPEAVDRNAMVIRTGPNQVRIEELHRWAEPLKYAIPRVVAANLSRELGGAQVANGRAGGDYDFRVGIEVSRFDSSPTQGAWLDAAWTVTPRAGAPIRGRTQARETANPGDYAGLASAHSRALDQLAREIAAAIGRRPSTPPPSARGG